MPEENNKKSHSNPTDLRIPNKSVQLKTDLINIAGHIGIPYGTWLRSEIIKLRDSYPEHMRKPFNKD